MQTIQRHHVGCFGKTRLPGKGFLNLRSTSFSEFAVACLVIIPDHRFMAVEKFLNGVGNAEEENKRGAFWATFLGFWGIFCLNFRRMNFNSRFDRYQVANYELSHQKILIFRLSMNKQEFRAQIKQACVLAMRAI